MLQSADLNLIQRDFDVPGLRRLLDESALLDSLRQRWPQVQWRSIQSRYLRYKPHTNCLVAYEAQILSDQGSGQSLWFYGKAFRQDDKEKLQKWKQRPGYSELLGSGRWVWPKDAVKVSFLPNDAKLKYLDKLLAPPLQARTLAKLLSRHKKSLIGELTLLRYKPERRVVMQWSHDSSAQALIKAYTPTTYQNAFKQAQAFKSDGELAIAPLLGHRHKHHFLAWQWLSGIPLPHWMTDSRFSIHDVKCIGSALARLHHQSPKHLQSIQIEDHRKAIHQLADWLQFVLPSASSDVRAIAQLLSEQLDQLSPMTTAIHGDFYADQVLWQGDRVAIIDLDRAAWGHPAQDIGNFFAHLEREVMVGNQTFPQIQPLEQAFLDGYKRVGASIPHRALTLYTALGLFFLTPEAFRYRHPLWPDRTQRILDRVSQLLNLGTGSRSSQSWSQEEIEHAR